VCGACFHKEGHAKHAPEQVGVDAAAAVRVNLQPEWTDEDDSMDDYKDDDDGDESKGRALELEANNDDDSASQNSSSGSISHGRCSGDGSRGAT
jgi:hypothetical protein